MQWVSVLKLSNMWSMTLIQDLALKQISAKICDSRSNEWIAALGTATQLRMQELRNIAIEKLEGKIGPVEKVNLAIRYSVKPWLIQGYRELVMRADGISAEEERQLGVRRTSNLFRLRHRRLENAISLDDAVSNIQTIFESEFNSIAAFDCSPISYFRPDLCTATNPDAIRLDETYYCVDIILQVKVFKSVPMHLMTHSTAGGKHFI
jgi:hypothetical protein